MTGIIRVGRGGAGNFVQQKDKDVADAEKAPQQQDLEAQKSASPAPAASQPPQYTRSGRGGAGNFAEPPTLAEAQAREDVVDRTDAAVSASLAGKARAGLSGRGGAGNWTTAAKSGEEADVVQARQSLIQDKVVHDIEASLPPPPRTYHQHDRQMEK